MTSKYIAQPQYDTNTVQIVENPFSASPKTITLSFSSSPNGALVYQDTFDGVTSYYLFVAFTFSTTSTPGDNGSVVVYDLDTIMAGPSAQSPSGTTLTLTNPADNPVDPSVQPIGMAIQPGTGTLYVATCNESEAYGTVNVFARTQGTPDTWATTGIPALTKGNSGDAIAAVVSNLAFDAHGNLWLTTFDANGSYLRCFITAPGAPVQPGTVLSFVNSSTAGLQSVLLNNPSGFLPPAGAPFLSPFSSPEGIAFDPAGNLWICNNNDDDGSVNPTFPTEGHNATAGTNGGGSLTRMSAAWIESLLYPTQTAGPITIPSMSVPADAVTTYYMNDAAQFGGLCFDGYTLYVNDENNYVDFNTDTSFVWRCDTQSLVDPTHTPAFASSFEASGVTSTNPGNGSMSVFNWPNPALTLTIRDSATDDGTQPDAAAAAVGGQPWESPDILINDAPDFLSLTFPGDAWATGPTNGIGVAIPNGTAPDTPLFTPVMAANQDGFIFVKVTNFGSQDSTGTEILKLYYGFASTGLDWPAPWDGSLFTSAATGTLPLGGMIGVQQLPVIPANSQMYLQFTWKAGSAPGDIPNPADYQAAGFSNGEQGHFCLLARVETSSVYPFGMFVPETVGSSAPDNASTDLKANVTNNAAIAWRNIAIANNDGFAPDFKVLKFSVLGANYAGIGRHFSFGVETIGPRGNVEPIAAKVVVQARGAALARLLATEFEAHRFNPLGEGRFELLDRDRGMAKIHLPALEVLPFTIEFTPQEGVRDFVVRVTQYLHVDGVEKVFGGQTFIVGEVEGFPRLLPRRW